MTWRAISASPHHLVQGVGHTDVAEVAGREPLQHTHRQGLTLLPVSAQRKHLLWAAHLHFSDCREHLLWARLCVKPTKTAQFESRSGRLLWLNDQKWLRLR